MFFIKILVRNIPVLNVRTSDFLDMGYNLKRYGWLNSFADVKNQSIMDDRVLWRGTREKRPEFFSIIFSALTDKDDIIPDWQCGVGSILTFFFFSCPHFVMFNVRSYFACLTCIFLSPTIRNLLL
jgi:hypothetical protein